MLKIELFSPCIGTVARRQRVKGASARRSVALGALGVRRSIFLSLSFEEVGVESRSDG